VLDSPDVFFERQMTFGRVGTGVRVVDRRVAIMAKLSALVFVVDAAAAATVHAFQVSWPSSTSMAMHRSRLQAPPLKVSVDEKDWLLHMVGGRVDVLIGKPILILCNKSDLPNAVTAEQLSERLLPQGTQLNGMRIRLQESAAIRDLGLDEGFQWLQKQLLSGSGHVNEPIRHVSIGKLADCRGFAELSSANVSVNSLPPKTVEVVQPATKHSVLTVGHLAFGAALNAAAALV